MFKTRKKTDADTAFIYNSWLKSYRNRHEDVRTEVYYQMQSAVIDKLLASAEVSLACNPDNHDEIYGYVVYEQLPTTNIIHYVYVKHYLRKSYIAKQLVEHALDLSKTTFVSHTPHHADSLLDKYKLIYNPFLRN